MATSVNSKLSMGTVLSLYWFLFWILNGFDKFFNADTFFGANFKAGLENNFLPALGLSTSLAWPIAIVVGVIELLLGLMFLMALIRFWSRNDGRYDTARAAITLSVLFFALLSAGAILFGARDPMWQHGTFIATLLLTQHALHVAAKSDA